MERPGDALCRAAPHLRATLVPEIARFSQARLTSGGLSAAFNTSLLAYNGCPLEFTVATSKPQALACTLDPFLPRFTENRRMAAFSRHVQHIVAGSPQDNVEACFASDGGNTKRSTQPLRFGSWLGRKYSPEAVKTKVYSEVHGDAVGSSQLARRGGKFFCRCLPAGRYCHY